MVTRTRASITNLTCSQVVAIMTIQSIGLSKFLRLAAAVAAIVSVEWVVVVHGSTGLEGMSDHHEERLLWGDYIQIHRRLRATRREYYLTNWRLLLPPFIAFFSLGFGVLSAVLSGPGRTFIAWLVVCIVCSLISVVDFPRSLAKRRSIIYTEWKARRTVKPNG